MKIRAFKKAISLILTVMLIIGTFNFPMASEITTAANADHVVISQVYGGGGNTGAPYKNDFIELYNPTAAAVDINGWSLQYTSKAGLFNSTAKLNFATLSGVIQPGAFFLVKCAAGTSTGTFNELPAADLITELGLSGSEGKVALVASSNFVALPTDAVDFVGYGAANQYEGSGAAPVLSSTMAAKRIDQNVDINNNASEFSKNAPEPRSGIVAPPTKCATPTADFANGAVLSGVTVTFATAIGGSTLEFNTESAAASTWTAGNQLTINGPTTVYVRAVKAGLENSDVATFVYTIDESAPITVAAAKELAVNTANVKVQGVVTYISGGNVYIQDNTAAICLYLTSSATRLRVGDQVTAVGKRETYNGLIELTGIKEASVAVLAQNQPLPEGQVVTISNMIATPEGKTLGFNNMCEIVKVEGATLTANADNTVISLMQAGATVKTSPVVVLSSFPGVAIGDTVNATLRVSTKSNVMEVAVIAMTKAAVEAPLEVFANPLNADVVTGTKVTLSSNNVAAKIFYTLDNTEPTETSLSYTSGIEIAGAIGDKITLKAFAKADGKANSNVLTSVYTIKAPDPAKTIKEVLTLPTGTADVTVKGTLSYFATSYSNPVIQSVIDGKTYGLYGFGAAPAGAKIGDEISLKGTYTIRNGAPQIAITGGEAKLIGKGETIQPEEMTIASILANGSGLLGRVVKIKNVTLGTYSASGSTPISQGEGADKKTINIYKGTAYPVQVVAGDVVDVYAMVTCNNTTIQLLTGTKEANGFNIYDVTNDTKAPLITLADAYLPARPAQDYTVAVKAEDNRGIAAVTLTYTIDGKTVTDQAMAYSADTQDYRFTIPGNVILKDSANIQFTVKAKDVTNLETVSASVTVKVDGAPQILSVMPARNSSTGANKSPEIAVVIGNGGLNPAVTLTLKKETTVLVDAQVMTANAEGTSFNYATKDLIDGIYTVIVKAVRSDSQAIETTWNFTVGTPKIQAYYGQLHSHTAQYSDGSGTLQDGLSYILNLPESEKVDFVSFTDHSNYFDTATEANPAAALNDTTKMTAASLATWNSYVNAMLQFNAANIGKVVAMPGFEMTWSGGPGHINTFNSKGVVSRNNKDLNNKTTDQGMKAYYENLIVNTDPLANLSQFNHPGSTFGTFADFAYWSPAYDNKMVAVEVGNGEGAVGSGGYFSSYNEYTKALDKGWHLAPTVNQDNHKGRWGNANTARTVILTDSKSTDGLLKGLKAMSVYATEDKNLEIQYTVNDQILGSTIAEVPTKPLSFDIRINDPDASDVISKVEIVSNGGRTLATKTFTENNIQWQFELPAVQGYYYVRVTQADKNIAVTAPVWIGQAPLVGISSFATDTKMPVTNEAVSLTSKLFNNEQQPVTLKSIIYRVGDTVIAQESPMTAIASGGQITHSSQYTSTVVGNANVNVTAIIDVNGQEKSFAQELTLNVRDASKLVYVGIDASHFNEYVNGNYKDSMGNFANLAVGYDVRVVELKTSEELIAATLNPKYRMLVLTPPTRRNDKKFLIGYKSYSDNEIAAIKAFGEKGNTVVITGWGDYYEGYTAYTDGTPHVLPLDQHMAAQQNKLLSALGASLRVSDDEIKDKVTNGGQDIRLYLTNYNMDNPLLAGVKSLVQKYSNYGGATIHAVDGNGVPTTTLPTTISPMVYGFETSESVDDDKTGTTAVVGVAVPKYNGKYMVAASETVAYANGQKATIIVAGAAFMSNFEVQVAMDSWDTPAYSNYTIVENIVKHVNPTVITDISALHAAKEGEVFTIRGIVTSNASGFDKETAFFDCIYLQDNTAGINAFPVSGVVKAGQTVEIKGKVSSYNGERQIAVEKVTIIDETVKPLPMPKIATAKEVAAATYLGSLIKLTGEVVKIDVVNNIVENIYVKDGSNETARVFIDGYITSKVDLSKIKVGDTISAIGLSSVDTLGNRLRVRDRAEIMSFKQEISLKTSHSNWFKDANQDITVTATLEEFKSVNVMVLDFVYDPMMMEFVDAKYLGGDLLLFKKTVDNGKIRIEISSAQAIDVQSAKDMLELTFKPLISDNRTTEVKLSKALFVTTLGTDEQMMAIKTDTLSMLLTSYLKRSDVNGDGKVNYVDLKDVTVGYRSNNMTLDVNLDGVVDMTDITLVLVNRKDDK